MTALDKRRSAGADPEYALERLEGALEKKGGIVESTDLLPKDQEAEEKQKGISVRFTFPTFIICRFNTDMPRLI